MNYHTIPDTWVYQNYKAGPYYQPESIVDVEFEPIYQELFHYAPDSYASSSASSESNTQGSVPPNYSTSSSSAGQDTLSVEVAAVTYKSKPDKIERRREQNRSSQRAYRERKERQQAELEEEVAKWRQKHSQVSHRYEEQSEEVRRLHSKIEKLDAEIRLLRNSQSMVWNPSPESPTTFDLVPFFDEITASHFTTL